MAERCMRKLGLESRLAAFHEANVDWSKARYIRDGTWVARPDGELTTSLPRSAEV